MKQVLVIFGMVFAGCAVAQDSSSDPEVEAAAPVAIEVTDQTLDEYLWLARPLVVFADTPLDPSFGEQMRLLAERPEALRERDVIVLTDTNPAAKSAIREKLRPHGFDLVLIDKDGRITFRKPVPWDIRELSRAIDKTPLRIQEMRDRRLSGR